MPQRRIVKTLKTLCARVMEKFYAELCDENRRLQLTDHLMLKPAYQELVEYLNRLPISLLEYTTAEYLKNFKRLRILEAKYLVPDKLLLLVLGVRVENILCCFTSITFPVVDFMRQHSMNITSLTLVSYDSVKNLTTVRSLFSCLRNLEELSIKSKEISKYCVKILTSEPLLPKLRDLRLRSFPCPFENDLQLAKFLSSRKQIQHFSYNGLIHFFIDLGKQKINLDLTELVVEVSSVIFSTHEIYQVAGLESMTECCKNLKALDIEYYFKHGFEFLTKLKKLETLRLRNQNNDLINDWKKFLQNFSNLHTLDIYYTGVISVRTFSESVPLLKSLSVCNCYFEESSVTPNCLPNLEYLRIIDPTRGFTPDVIFEFLTSSYKLRSIKIDEKTEALKTEKFLDILAVNKLDYLESFDVKDCQLSYLAVETLLNNTNNNLEYIYIESSSIFDRDFPYISKMVMDENLSIFIKLVALTNKNSITIDNRP